MVRKYSALRRVLLFLLIVSFMITVTSCRVFRRPTTPQDGGAMPPIPSKIARGDRLEPNIRVYLHETGQIQTMGFEEYLLGVVAAEMEPTWPAEALAAQAIVARAFTLDKIARQGGVPGRNADASTDIQEFQAYDASRINDNVRQAVQRTRGTVLAFQGEFVRTWFSAYCDGMTSTAEDGLAFREFPTPFITRVTDICPERTPENVQGYTVTFTKSEVTQAMQQAGQNTGSFSQIDVVNRDQAGRAVSVRIGQATVSGPAFRIAIGSTRLRSTKWDSVTVTGDRVTFVGSGYGHGVGMCQWGARARAEQGNSFEQIVKGFFPNTQLGKIWD
ncbi:MAG: SpoIID/LytB domain-containing protein [Bacillota bacterium]|nr:MAG: SpoIID/LytB domain-containing protein [Bacillota bacterium]MBS3950601.1 SpoIID/LytB domain-containing protein [Peptococcaceae bacterium]